MFVRIRRLYALTSIYPVSGTFITRIQNPSIQSSSYVWLYVNLLSDDPVQKLRDLRSFRRL